MSRSLAQQRAAHALDQITALKNVEHGNYLAFVKSIPAKIIMSGLGQALAMEKASSKSGTKEVAVGHGKLYAHLEQWLCKGWQGSPYLGKADVIEAITKGSQDDYVRAQAETMAYLEWLKKFAVAYLKGEKEMRDETAV